LQIGGVRVAAGGANNYYFNIVLNNMRIEMNLSKNYDFNRNIGNIYNKYINMLILITKVKIIQYEKGRC